MVWKDGAKRKRYLFDYPVTTLNRANFNLKSQGEEIPIKGQKAENGANTRKKGAEK